MTKAEEIYHRFVNYEWNEIGEGMKVSIIKAIDEALKEGQKLPIHSVKNWVAFDFMKLETRPPKYGKYLITRKDGKIHWETWNGSGWAYNHNEIRYWAEIKPPCL